MSRNHRQKQLQFDVLPLGPAADTRIPPTDGEENLLALRPQWVDDMATGLRPVADSVGVALNALRRNIPPAPKAEGGEKPQAWLNHSDSSRVG